MQRDIFIATTQLRILAFLAIHPDESFYEREIARKAKISAGGANAALNALFKRGVLQRRRVGKCLLYTLNDSLPVVQYFKILNIITLLEPVVESLRELSSKILLYGSFSRGENTRGSDVDVLIVSNRKEHIEDLLQEYTGEEGKDGMRIQAVIRTPAEWMALETKDPVFFSELLKGITLWDRGRDEE